MALVVKNTPANAGDIREGSSIPGVGKRPFKESMATYSRENLLPRKSMDREAGRLQSIGSQRVRQNWSNVAHMYASPYVYHSMNFPFLSSEFVCMPKHFLDIFCEMKYFLLYALSVNNPSLYANFWTQVKQSQLFESHQLLPPQGSSEELGRCERPPSTTFAFSFSKQGIGMWTIKKAGLGPDS